MSATSKAGKRPQPDLNNPKLWKTKLCYFYQQDRCHRGEACGFAHGGVELESAPDLSKTSICLAWKAGTCPLSSTACRFAHGKHDLRAFAGSEKPPQGIGESTVAQSPAKNPGLQASDSALLVSSAASPLPPPTTQQPVLPATPLRHTQDLEPMVVKPPFPNDSGDLVVLPPVEENSLFAQWGQWESETVAGESSSDDGGSHSSAQSSKGATGCRVDAGSPATHEPIQKPQCPPIGMVSNSTEFSMFGASNILIGAPGDCPSYNPLFSKGDDAPVFSEYSAFSGMPRLI